MNPGIAPADARPHSPWPPWRKIVAYILLAALAIGSILYIDRGVMRSNPPRMQTSPELPAPLE